MLLMGKIWMNKELWHQASGNILFTTARVLWDFRVSLMETLLGTAYDEMRSIVVLPVLGWLISAALQGEANLIGDTSLFLVAWSLGALANVGFMIVFLVWARSLLVPALLAVALRACRSPMQLFRDLFGMARFRPAGAYTPGMHFFATDTGITGSTNGPVTARDSVALIRGPTDFYLVLRPCHRGYKVVGVSYVGNKSTADEVSSGQPWINITIY